MSWQLIYELSIVFFYIGDIRLGVFVLERCLNWREMRVVIRGVCVREIRGMSVLERCLH